MPACAPGLSDLATIWRALSVQLAVDRRKERRTEGTSLGFDVLA